MHRICLLITALLTLLTAQTNAIFTPILQADILALQNPYMEEVGSFEIECSEVGLGISYKNLYAHGTIEAAYNSDDSYDIALYELYSRYGFTEHLSLTGGQFISNFGTLESEAHCDPYMTSWVETKRTGVQVDAEVEKVQLGFTVYNGITTENFASFMPMVGFDVKDMIHFKQSARFEILPGGDLNTDLSTSFSVTPEIPFQLISELFINFYDSPQEDLIDGQEYLLDPILMYYAELDFYPSEKVTLFCRFEHSFLEEYLMDSVGVLEEPVFTGDTKRVDDIQIPTGIAFSPMPPLRFAFSYTPEFFGTSLQKYDHLLAAEISFDLSAIERFAMAE